jgi:hypothetical protein
MADRKISDLTALTTPASGDFLPIVDISEAAAASKNKRITIEELMRGVPDGTAAAPGIAFETDPNTGIYSPGADQLAVATNGTGRLFVDANGRVGAGNSSPGSYNASADDLVVGSSGDTGVTIVSGTSSQGSIFFADGTTGGAQQAAGYLYYLHSNDSMTLGTSNSPRMTITSAGLVGIGTSAPGTTLEVSAGGGSSPSLTGTGGNFAITQPGLLTSLEFGGYSSAPYGLWLQTKNKTGGSFPLILNPLGGAVGIGTTAPGSPLSVQGSDNSVIAHFHGTTGTNTRGLQIGLATNVTANHLVDLNAVGTYGTLTFSSNSNEKARIDSSGRLLVGTSTARANFYNSTISALFQQEGATSAGDPASRFMSLTYGKGNNDSGVFVFAKHRATTVGGQTVVVNGDGLGELNFQGSDGTEFVQAASIRAEVDGTPGANDMPGRIVLATTADGASSPTERMRIGSNGLFSTFFETNGITSRSAASNGTTSFLYRGMYNGTGTIAGGSVSYYVYTNGNVENTNNSYGAISDVKLKENIVDAGSQWDDLKALQVRKYNFKEGQTHTQIGLVAQEVELVSPGLVSESPDRDEDGNDLGTVTKSVNYSVLYMKAVKALQEAMERIEALEADVAQLKGA